MKGYFHSVRAHLTAALPVVFLCAGVVCIAGVSMVLSANTIPGGIGEVRIEEEDDTEHEGNSSISNQCYLLISTCPAENPRCGQEPLAVPILCSDARCTASSCIKASEYKSSQAPSNNNSGTSNAMCVLQTFSCAKNALPSCFKRVRSAQLDCRDSGCGAGSCIPLESFVATNMFQPWDLGKLEGPFPRTETMCVIERSSCPPNDPSCLSPVSIEQIPCTDSRCATGGCTRMTVQVDEKDNIVNSKTETTSGQQGGTREEGNAAEKTEGATPTLTVEPIIRQVPVLGCFTDAGSWTTDRTLCATDQSKFTQQQATNPTPAPSPEMIRETNLQIEEQFVPDTRHTSLVQSLLATITDATGRLSVVLQNPGLPQDLRISINETMEWLRAVQRTASQDDQSINDLQLLADSVGARLGDAQKAILAWAQNAGQPSQPPPQTLTDKMDKIMTALPSAFALLQGEMIPLPADAVTNFVDAQVLYESLKPLCLSNPASCGQLSLVVDKLVPVVAAMKAAIDQAGRPDLEMQIELLMQ